MNLLRKTLAGALAVIMAAGIIATAPLAAYAKENNSDAGQVSIVRLGGKDRYETANMIADADRTSADTVFLANSGSYADALAGTPLAYAYSAPILLTDSKKLPDSVKDEIKKLGAKKVILLGGTAVISKDVEDGLKTAGYTVERIAGETRYATALKIAEALAAKGDGIAYDVFIASGVNYPDALSASSPAAIKHAPILYAPADGKLDKASAGFIEKSKPYNAYILGGKAAVGEAAEDAAKKAGAQSVQRLGGSDRYETSLIIAKQFDPQFKGDDIAFATGRNFPDALAGSVLAARNGIPVLLTDNKTVRKDVKEYIESRTRSKAYVFGGTSVVSDDIINGYISSGSAEIKAGASVENGVLVIRIANSNNDLAWAADEMAQDNSVLKYEGSEVKDGFFTARYSVAGDGKMAVSARHFYSNTICDELHSWDVTVKDGKITNISPETVKKSPAESGQNALLSGSWTEDKTQYTSMNVSKNEDRGWNVEISAPMTRGAYVFKATVYYDCELDAFAYNKGKFFDLNTDGTCNPDAAVAGSEGYIKLSGSLSGSEKAPVLVWHSTDDSAKKYVSADITYVRISDSESIDYMVLVNKLNKLPENWEDALETVHIKNSVGDDVEVEIKAYNAYEELRKDLEKNDGIYIELDSARRSVAAQQEIMDRFIEKYGADYAAKTVAVPGYSEHHTGLALDLYFRLDGKDVYYNEDMVKYPEIWSKIHAKLSKYGFILRYLEGREHITGYGYEPWHIRYVDSAEIAGEIMSKNLTLEEYLGAVKATDVSINYGSSSLYSKEELEAAVIQIKCKFASYEGCELHSIRYAGDGKSTEEALKWVNEISGGSDYTQVAEFLMDFHSPTEDVGSTLELDMEYKDYQWWLARKADGGWEIVSFGY